MITFKKQWVTTKNSVVYQITTGNAYTLQAYLWELKDAIVNPALGGVWTVLASSDGTTADTNDNWANPSDVVHGATSGSARAWILLESPSSALGPYYLLLDNWHTNSHQCQIYFTQSQPNIASPSTTARPASTGDEWSYANAYPSDLDVDYFHSCHCSVADDGSFFFAVWVNEKDTIGELFAFNVWDPDTTHSGETVGASSLLTNDGSTIKRYHDDAANVWKSLHPADGSQVTLAPVSYLYDTTQVVEYMHEDTIDNNYRALPVYLFCTDATKYSLRGALGDLYLPPDYLQDGAPVYDDSGVKACKIGPYWVPNSALPRQ